MKNTNKITLLLLLGASALAMALSPPTLKAQNSGRNLDHPKPNGLLPAVQKVREARANAAEISGLLYPAPSGLLTPAVQKVVAEHAEALAAFRMELGHALGFTRFLQFFAYDAGIKSDQEARELTRYYENLEFAIVYGFMDYNDEEWLEFLDYPELGIIFREQTNAVIERIILGLLIGGDGVDVLKEPGGYGSRIGHFLEGGEGFDYSIDPDSRQARYVREIYRLIGLDLDGGEGNDLVVAPDQVLELLIGGDGADVLNFPDGRDAAEVLSIVLGQDGSDFLFSDGDRSHILGVLIGGLGTDLLKLPTGEAAESILGLLIGGEGVDVIRFPVEDRGVEVLGIMLGQDGSDLLLFTIGESGSELLNILISGDGNDFYKGSNFLGGVRVGVNSAINGETNINVP